ncbi:glycine zipper 2TM domain-containing protein [Sphingobium estronivorans]|uniref:glycine zipper 2TM domain-containing protein n=1 Tax=Sphingobium estronivorans TaxID=1577690 RepID=UPI00123917A9|nr:glycine zipper 2TM domain-containing protein [Sphingobium estronivorans]
MKFTLKAAFAALSLGAVTLSAAPAAADPPPWAGHGRGHDDRGRGDWKHDGRHDNGRRTAWTRPGRVIYNYDWNRPDPRYGRYYRADRYYRGGYEPIRVTRNTRIYRGYDDRYYCRRSDGTTGLIVGAALGGLLGGQLDRGYSNTAGVLIGAGAGALLGREIDRGGLNCR